MSGESKSYVLCNVLNLFLIQKGSWKRKYDFVYFWKEPIILYQEILLGLFSTIFLGVSDFTTHVTFRASPSPDPHDYHAETGKRNGCYERNEHAGWELERWVKQNQTDKKYSYKLNRAEMRQNGISLQMEIQKKAFVLVLISRM